jgi:hypothetical protein
MSFRPRRRVAVCVALLLPALLGTASVLGCQDPCLELAERVCACERTLLTRAACRRDRITSRQVETDEQDREFCATKLATCTCLALDENQLELCGFVPEDTP